MADEAEEQKLGTSRRAPHKKSRKGCSTCKERHIRCDQRKPTCERCDAAGRACGGYLSPSELTVTRRPVPVGTVFKNTFAPLQMTSSASSYANNREESQAFEYFKHKTIPILQRPQQYRSWDQTLLQILESVPAIRHIVLAVGSCHARIDAHLDKSKDAVSRRPSSTAPADTFEWRHYNKALRALHESIATQSPPPFIVIALSSLMFILFESLQGRRNEMYVHLYNGLNIIAQRDNSTAVKEGISQRDIENSFSMLCLQAFLYSTPQVLPPKLERITFSTLNPMFAFSPDEPDEVVLKATVTALLAEVMAFSRKVTLSLFNNVTTPLSVQMNLEHRAVQLSTKLLALESNRTRSAPSKSSQPIQQTQAWNIRDLTLMRAQVSLCLIFIRAVTARHQTAYDRYFPTFASIIDAVATSLSPDAPTGPSSSTAPQSSKNPLTGALPYRHKAPPPPQAPTPSPKPAFSIATGVISTLFLTVTQCRHPALRRRAAALLRSCPQHEGLWNATEAARAAEIVIAFEERNLGRSARAAGIAVQDGGHSWKGREAAEQEGGDAVEADGGESAPAVIPEQDRSHFVERIDPGPRNGYRPAIRLYWKPDSSMTHFQTRLFYLDGPQDASAETDEVSTVMLPFFTSPATDPELL